MCKQLLKLIRLLVRLLCKSLHMKKKTAKLFRVQFERADRSVAYAGHFILYRFSSSSSSSRVEPELGLRLS